MVLRWMPLLLLVALGSQPVSAQDSTAAVPDTVRSWQEAAWTRIVERNGLEISFIFYSEAENRNDGVVVRLRNQNEYPVRYAFTIIFRGPESEATAPVEGTLAPGEMRTGSDSGLFWVPFEDERSIGEVGLRNLRVTAASGRGEAWKLRLRGDPGPPKRTAKLYAQIMRRKDAVLAFCPSPFVA